MKRTQLLRKTNDPSSDTTTSKILKRRDFRNRETMETLDEPDVDFGDGPVLESLTVYGNIVADGEELRLRFSCLDETIEPFDEIFTSNPFIVVFVLSFFFFFFFPQTEVL